MKPEYAVAAGILKKDDNPVALAKVDCTEGGKSTCEKYSVSGYPTLKIFRKGELSSEYNGPRESSKFFINTSTSNIFQNYKGINILLILINKKY